VRHLDADDGIGAGVEARGSAEHRNSDLLFGERLSGMVLDPAGEEHQEFTETSGTVQSGRPTDALDELPAEIRCRSWRLVFRCRVHEFSTL
jgi:hypothetical protein